MIWLLWREYRRNRWILAAGAMLLLLPSLNALRAGSADIRLALFVGYCFFCSLTVALLAGNAIAGERADRSAEFIAYLPPGRWRLLASKLFLSLIRVTVICGVYLLSLPAGTAMSNTASTVPKDRIFISLLLIQIREHLSTTWTSGGHSNSTLASLL